MLKEKSMMKTGKSLFVILNLNLEGFIADNTKVVGEGCKGEFYPTKDIS